MKKKLISCLFIALAAVFVLAACDCSGNGKKTGPYTNTYTQGVTTTSIKVGNSLALTGLANYIGLPFQGGMKAQFKKINDAGGINGRTIDYIAYDDAFTAALGLPNTEKLINEDNVFALVGAFGTPTVGATIDIIREKGIPTLYYATGISALYEENVGGNNRASMPVQPIFDTEGRMMVARALEMIKDPKIGVFYTNDDAGKGMFNGIKLEAKEINYTYISRMGEAAAADYNAQALALKDCDVILVAGNQAPFEKFVAAMAAGSVNKPVITSYVSASPACADNVKAYISGNRQVYTNAWLDTTSPTIADELAEYMATADVYYKSAAGGSLTGDALETAKNDTFSIAGYVAAKMFTDALTRVGTGELTWKSFIEACEESPMKVPMGGTIDYKNDRIGITALALNKFVYTAAGAGTLEVPKGITLIEDVRAARKK